VNRQGLDVTLLAEPSSDEDEVTTIRKKRSGTLERRPGRRKPATTSSSVVTGDKENKTDATLAAPVSASVGSHSADSVSHSKPVSAVKTRKRPKSTHRLFVCLFMVVDGSVV